MIIYFVRHGQTADNRRGIIQGHIDTPLNEHGRKEAKLLGHRLSKIKFDEAWSSNLSRARETAEIVLKRHPGLAVQTDPGLMERCLGSLQGTSGLKKGQKVPDDVEGSDAFRNRITDWFSAFLANYYSTHAALSDPPTRPTPTTEPRRERTILVASHGAYLHCLQDILLHRPFSLAVNGGVDLRASCRNASIMKVIIRPRKSVIQAVPAMIQPDPSRDQDQSSGKEVDSASVDHSLSKSSGYVGVIMSWADVKHLDATWEKLGVADDID